MKRLIVYLCILQVLDVVSTVAGIELGGAKEANPVGVALLGGGYWVLVVAKLLGMGAVVVLATVLWCGRHPVNRWQALAVIRTGCVMMVGVVAWNSWVGVLS